MARCQSCAAISCPETPRASPWGKPATVPRCRSSWGRRDARCKNATYAHCEIEKDCRSGGTHNPSPLPSPYLTLVGLGLGYPCGRWGGRPREKALSILYLCVQQAFTTSPAGLSGGVRPSLIGCPARDCNGWHCKAKTWGRLSYCAALRSSAGVTKIPNPCQAWGVGCSNYGSARSALLCNDVISYTSQLSDDTASSIVVARCLLHPIWDERAFFVAIVGRARQIISVFYRHAWLHPDPVKRTAKHHETIHHLGSLASTSESLDSCLCPRCHHMCIR